MLGAVFLLIAYFPKAASAIWGYLGFSFFTLYLGEIINLPGWIKKLTPYGFISKYPIENINWWALAILCVIAAGLTVLALVGYKKRDMQTL